MIHAMAGEQDMQKMGGLKRYMPVTFVTMMIGTRLEARSRRHTSKPDMSGRRRSSNTTAGGLASMDSRNSRPRA